MTADAPRPAPGAPPAAPTRSGPRGRIRIAPRPSDAAADAAELQRKVSQVSRGAVRAAVLGVNDGLVTILALILALAGAAASVDAVRLAGVASLVAGAFSMAAGEWVSVRAQVDLYTGVLGELRQLVSRNPKVVLETLEERLERFGMDTPTAQRASTEIGLDEELFLSFTARTVFGVVDEELGSPFVSAASSFVLFSLGALLPLVPWFFTEGAAGVAWTVGLSSVSAAVVGGYISSSAGTARWRGALRQLTIVALAAGVTYGIGLAFGATVA
ncbi:MAG: VIT1/CCC1 transporter family protein [Acidimicrobiales bacterium]